MVTNSAKKAAPKKAQAAPAPAAETKTPAAIADNKPPEDDQPQTDRGPDNGGGETHEVDPEAKDDHEPEAATAAPVPIKQPVPVFHKDKPYGLVLYGKAQGNVRFIQNHHCFDNEGNHVCHEDDRK